MRLPRPGTGRLVGRGAGLRTLATVEAFHITPPCAVSGASMLSATIKS